MGADQGDGTASWQGSRLKLNYPQRNSSVLADIYTAFDRISSLSGKKVYFLRDRPITVHPFGGARLGQSTADSVINACGEVHDIPGLFIADGSALPAAPGVPPSMTIAAWAGHIAAQLISSSPSTHQEVA
nr:GMC oxidoreductase [Alcanivorax sp. 1008]